MIQCISNILIIFNSFLVLIFIVFKCKGQVDVGFLLDSSGSLSNDYDREKEFMKQLAGSFVIGQDATRLGVITFSQFADYSIRLSDFDNKIDFDLAVDAIPLMGSTTRIDKALLLAQTEMFQLTNGGRGGVPKLLVLLTDGTQSSGPDVIRPDIIADEIRNSGINLLVVGIGQNVDYQELQTISGNSKNAFVADSFEELTSSGFIGNIAQQSCKEGEFYIV